uniref:KAP NTPase domain-containing protein n=1 Tax=Ciona savignyi TaxID=51511 RepID=H2YLT8_CIOSA
MPAAMACLVVFSRFCYAMFQSQTRRVNRALVGVKGNMAAELGFMNKVKDEVKIIEKLVRCLRFTHSKNYKIIISIDDLDRCPHEKVKSVLEAVNILLSDRSSPFVCLIALDSRVAVKCIEEDMGAALLKANVNGHEYLKKIINLPFCLPELGLRDKRRYFAGMMDQADRTKLQKKIPKLAHQEISKQSTPRSASDVLKFHNCSELHDTSTQTAGDGSAILNASSDELD